MQGVTVAVRFASEEDATAFLTKIADNSSRVEADVKVVIIQFETLADATAFTDENQDIHAFVIFQDSKNLMTITNKPSCISCSMPLNEETTELSRIPNKLCSLCDENSCRACLAPYSN
jgi:hypothetical protein